MSKLSFVLTWVISCLGKIHKWATKIIDRQYAPVTFTYWYWDEAKASIESKTVNYAADSFIVDDWNAAVDGGFLPKELLELNFGNKALLLKHDIDISDEEFVHLRKIQNALMYDKITNLGGIDV